MRLIDADVLEYHEIDEIGGEYEPYLGCSKEYIDRQPTVDVLDKIRAEIEKVFCMSVVTNELRTPMEVKVEILQIIDKYRAKRSDKE